MRPYNPDKHYKCKKCREPFHKKHAFDVYCSAHCKISDKVDKDQAKAEKANKGAKIAFFKTTLSSRVNTFRTSTGERVTKFEIDRRTKLAKQEYTFKIWKQTGQVICENCNDPACYPVQRSHIISVNEAQNSGRAELCWDIYNLEHLGQACHQLFETKPKQERENYYNERRASINLNV